MRARAPACGPAFAGLGVLVALLFSGCDAFVEFCENVRGGSFKLGGVQVSCQGLTDSFTSHRELWLRIASDRPHRVGRPVVFEVNTPVSGSRIDWDLDGDREFDDATGRRVERTYSQPTASTSPDERVGARLTDAVGNDRGNDAVFFRVEPADGSAAPGGQGPTGSGRSAAASPPTSSAAGRRFSARFGIDLFQDTVEVRSSNGGLSVKNAYGIGELRGRLPGKKRSRTLDAFLSSTWLTRYSASLSRGGRLSMRGVALVHFPEMTGESCVRYRLAGSGERPAAGTLRILGGTDEAGALRGTARFALRLKRSGRLTLKGKIDARTAQAGKLPSACAALAAFSAR